MRPSADLSGMEANANICLEADERLQGKGIYILIDLAFCRSEACREM